MNNYLHNHYRETKLKFQKFSSRLSRSQEKGEFQRLSRGKQNFLVNRVKKLWEKLRILEVQLKIGTAAAALALLLMVSNVGAQEQFVPAPDKNPLPLPTIFGLEPILADLDADGDVDMFLTNVDYYSPERILYYKNTGSPTAPVFTKSPSNENPFRNLSDIGSFSTDDFAGSGDIDGDGDIDIVSDEGEILRNTGDKNNPLFTAETTYLNNDNMDLGDIDGDGDLDIMGVTYDSTLLIRPNEGDATNFNINVDSPITVDIGNWNKNIQYTGFTRAVDLDSDGDLDIIFSGEIYDYNNLIFGMEYIFIAENTGTAQAPAFSLVDDIDNPFSDIVGSKLQVGDLDGDGDFDALLSDYSSGITYHEFDNGNLAENKDLIPELYDGVILPANYYFSPQFADMDGDGDQDILAVDYYGFWDLIYYEYQETGKPLKYVRDDNKDFPFIKDGLFLIQLPFVADMDLDGDLDVILLYYDLYTENDVEYKYFENTGTDKNPVYEEDVTKPIPADPDFLMIPSFADIDGDGDMDIFFRSEEIDINTYSGSMVTKYLENTGTDQLEFTERTGSENPLAFVNGENYGEDFAYFKFQFGDIDEDGDLDVVFSDYYGSIYYLENIGSKTEPSFVDKSDNSPFSNISAGYYSTLNLVDMDGDGDMDLFTHSYYGVITEYYENTGWKGGTGISDKIMAEQLDLFPNPVVNDLNIRMENELRGELSYEILTLQGKRVSNGMVTKPGELLEFRISSDDLATGMYIFRLWSDEDVYISKFVKQ